MKTLHVEVKPDHLRRLALVKQPVWSIAELIWNGLDADATEVAVQLQRDVLGRIERITVRDNGTGMTYRDAEIAFGSLGGSWKKSASRTRTAGRLLHGRQGKGRFRAFALGHDVEWKTVVEDGGALTEFTVSGSLESLGEFTLGDESASSRTETGTEVVISNVPSQFPSLDPSSAVQQLNQEFANYLRKYSDVVIRYAGERLDPSSFEDLVRDYPLTGLHVDGREVAAELSVIEWSIEMERALYLCDAGGFALERVPPGIQAPGFSFTAFVKSDELRRLDEDGLLMVDPLSPDLTVIVDAAKRRLREHFRSRLASRARRLVDEWKREKVYPYTGAPRTAAEEVERQVFDVLALNVHEYLPDFSAAETRSRRLSLRLLKQALEESPEALQRILVEVLDLPASRREELARLLERTSLAAMIQASKTVTDRLEFVRGLEELVFAKDLQKVVKERSQLHKLLEHNTWIFGEEYHLALSDKSLTAVLAEHRPELDPADVDEVALPDGRRGIVDLLLGRAIPQPRAEEREHLVIELKRPSKVIDARVYAQIESYAFAVAADERFRDVKTRWTFVAIARDLDDVVRRKASQKNRPLGLTHDDDDMSLRIWVKPWSQVFHDAKARLAFFQKGLGYDPDREEGLQYLRDLYEEYLPEEAKDAGRDVS